MTEQTQDNERIQRLLARDTVKQILKGVKDDVRDGKTEGIRERFAKAYLLDTGLTEADLEKVTLGRVAGLSEFRQLTELAENLAYKRASGPSLDLENDMNYERDVNRLNDAISTIYGI